MRLPRRPLRRPERRPDLVLPLAWCNAGAARGSGSDAAGPQMSTGSAGAARPLGRGRSDGVGAPAQLPHDHLDGTADGDPDAARPTNVPSPPATRPPSVAPTSTAIRTQKGLSWTVLLMMTGLRTWFSICW